MDKHPATGRKGPSGPLPLMIALSPLETKKVAGGGSNVRHGNPGGEPAPYNTPGNPDYGQSRPSVTPGDGPDLF